MSSGGALVRLNFSTRSVILSPDALAFEALIWDPIRGEFIAVPISVVRGGARNQRAVIATPIVVSPADQILNCSIPVPAICQLPPAAVRNGIPLTFKDLGQAAVNNITFTPAFGETIDGQPNFVMTNNYQGVTLEPFNDAVNTGWSIQ
jgi:hypothetical protein